MINEALKLLEGDEVFQSQLPAIIEVFVSFYGEENRSRIEERFNNMATFCFNKPDEKKYIIDRTLEQIQNKHYQQFFSKYNMEYTEEVRNQYLPYSLQSNGYSLIEKLEEYLERRNKPTEEKRREVIDSFLDEIQKRYQIELTYEQMMSIKETENFQNFINSLPSYYSMYIKSTFEEPYKDIVEERLKSTVVEKMHAIDSSITMDNFDELYRNNHPTITRIISMVDDYNQMKINYNQEIQPLEPYITYIEKCKELKKEIDEKALISLIFKFQDRIPHKEIEQLEYLIDNHKYLDLYQMPTIANYFGTSLYTEPNISAFSKESNKILKDNKPEWKVNSIKNDRIRFFKVYGIDKGPNYSAYENDPECQKLIPNELFISEILDTKNKTSEQAQIEYYKSLPDFKNIRDKINSFNTASKENGFDANLYENTLMCICPNITYIDNEPALKPLGFFRLTISNIERLDAYIIHELNHVYELSLIEDTEDYTAFSCGWDVIVQPKNEEEEETLKKRETTRKYELFNEIINELISQDISKLLQENNVYLFSSKDNAVITHKTSYEQSSFIIRDFYELYIEDIKESRRNRNMTTLFAKVGEDNFNALNDLFHVFHDNFNEFKLIAMFRDYKEGKETEETKLYQSIIDQKNAIIKKMQAQTEEYNNTHGLNI